MNINEVEKLLSVTRSNIRFYEKAGLINPERSENNYRNYSEADIAELKKILVLRKLGFTVEEIKAMQNGELSLPEAAGENISRLEKEIESLKGALEFTKEISAQKSEFSELDQEKLWDEITNAEQDGQEFTDILKDYRSFELFLFDNMWKNVFFHNFEKTRLKYGLPKALGIVLLMCIIRGISKVVIWHGSFWDGFFYPFVLFIFVSILFLPIYILAKKAPKAAKIVVIILLTLGILFFAAIALLIIYGIFNRIFNP